MPRRKTNEEYIQECKDKGYDLPIEDYKGARIKIKHTCRQGHIYSQVPDSHLSGVGCPICSGLKNKTPEEYIGECKKEGLDLPIEDYISISTKIKHKCRYGHIYLQRPHDHLNGQGCPICRGKKKKTSKEYYNDCKEKGYDLPIESYINSITKIKHKCKYGHIYEQRPNSNLRGIGCPICSGKKKKIPEEYLNECRQKSYDLPIEEYKNSKTKINHRCNKGHIYKQTPSDHLRGIGCPICRESHGERFIRNYLNTHSIKYEAQKTFRGLKDKQPLSYDFYLPDHNILIEYQGIQHYEMIDHFGGEEQFKNQQSHDTLKHSYAKDNGYKLVELYYTLDTQEKVNNYLNKTIK